MSKTTIRQWHSYIGVFIAPSVLLFALTGAVQIFNLHEAHGGYVPPAVVEKLSSLHKDQVFAAGHHHDGPPPGALPAGSPPPAKPDDDDDDDKLKPATLILKYFFLLVAICLALSTCFGLWMGLTQTRRKGLAWGLLIAGLVVPLGLLLAA
jgi:hypothetical protein